MDYKAIEEKWNAVWEKEGLHTFDRKNADNKYYVLEMFSYPSAGTQAKRAIPRLPTIAAWDTVQTSSAPTSTAFTPAPQSKLPIERLT